MGRLLSHKMGNSIKYLFQGHSDALPYRESNQGLKTLQNRSIVTLLSNFFFNIFYYEETAYVAGQRLLFTIKIEKL